MDATVLPVREEMVERRGVGKGGVFPDRRIFAVLMSIRPKRRRIERNDAGAGALRAAHALDGGMGQRDRRNLRR